MSAVSASSLFKSTPAPSRPGYRERTHSIDDTDALRLQVSRLALDKVTSDKTIVTVESLTRAHLDLWEISEQEIARMQPTELKKLSHIMEQIKGDEEGSTFLSISTSISLSTDSSRSLNSHSPASTPHSQRSPKQNTSRAQEADRILSVISEVQENQRNAQLLEEICNDEKVWIPLAFQNASLIRTDKLFWQIFKEVEKRHVDTKRIDTLLCFCIVWLENNSTKHLSNSTEHSLSQIVKRVRKISSDQLLIRKAERIVQLCLSQTEKHISFEKKANPIDFFYILEKVKKKSYDSGYEEVIEYIANDLLYLQIQYYKQMSMHCFVTINAESAILAEYQHNLKRLSTFVLNMILYEDRLDYRKRIMRLFLDVADQSLAKKDFATCYCLSIIVRSSDLAKLKKTWRAVFKNSKYQTIKETLLKLFAKNGNSTPRGEYEKCIKSKTAYTPYIQPFLDQMAEISRSDEEIPTSLLKLKQLQAIADDYFTAQKSWQEAKNTPRCYVTNLVYEKLYEHESSERISERASELANQEANS